MVANEDIKEMIRKKRLHRYEVARAMGISDGYLSKLLRDPLSDDNRRAIMDAINRIIEQEEKNKY